MKTYKCILTTVLVAVFFSVTLPGVALASDDLEGVTGNYRLVEHQCPGGIASAINVGVFDGLGVVKTSLGYLFTINKAGQSVMIKNGPTTICTGSMVENKFSGSCMDNSHHFCAVIYQKD